MHVAMISTGYVGLVLGLTLKPNTNDMREAPSISRASNKSWRGRW